MLLDKVAGTIFRYNMLPPGARIGVAVSGGADSVCLLHVLRRLGWPLHVLHLDHGLRGAESAADAVFVADLAESLGLPFECRPACLGAGNVESAGRLARRVFFADAREKFGLAAVATGHTRSDQAETVLFRAMRGTGPRGLAGIRPVTREGLVRPLFEVDREEVRAWLTAEGLAWREDSSNHSPKFARNRLRHEAIPLLESILPQSAASLARLAEVAREDEEWWEAEVARIWQPAAERRGVVILDAGWLAGLPPALARRAARHALERAAGYEAGFALEHVDGVLSLARSAKGYGSVAAPHVDVRRSQRLIRFSSRAARVVRREWSLEIAGTGRYESPGGTVLTVETAYNEDRDRLDVDRMPFPWTLRNWRPGDAYQPAGASGPVKLKELFQRGGIPSWDRFDWPMIEWQGRVAWSSRFGAAAWAAAKAESVKVVQVGICRRRYRGE